MKAAIIPSSFDTLMPLSCGQGVLELPVMGRPILYHIKNLLKAHNIVELVEESSCLSAEDELILVEQNLISNCDITAACEEHKKYLADITVVMRKRTAEYSHFSVAVSKDNFIKEITDSKHGSFQSEHEPEGIYILSPVALKKLEDGDFTTGMDLLKAALDKKLSVRSFVSGRPSVTIASAENYRMCHMQILKGALYVKTDGVQIRSGLWVEENVSIESGVKIETPVYISKGCHIEQGVELGGGSFIGKGTVLRHNAVCQGAVIGKNCTLSENAAVYGGVISHNVNIGAASRVLEGAVVSSGCRIEEGCVISAGVKIWPNKRILQSTRVNDNLIWGSVATERLFKNGKICGELNIDITPEFMAKLGMAVGTLYKFGKIGLGYDSAPVCSMLATAVKAGLISAGTQLFMLGEQSLPVMRRAARHYGLLASVYINQSSADGMFYPEIDFLDKSGANLSANDEKKLEGTFFNNVFFRADSKKLCKPYELCGYKISYVREVLKSIKSTSFNKNFEARTRSETISDILEPMLWDTESLVDENSPREFSMDISNNGEEYSLYDTHGNRLDDTAVLCILITILLKHMNEKKLVLPISAPTYLEKIISDNGGCVVYCGTSTCEIMHTMLENGLDCQLNLFFDGIYAALMLLDYLNFNNISLDSVLKEFPRSCRTVTEVECPDSKKHDIIDRLFEKYNNEKTDLTDGIKIYQSNGWVLILPENHRHCVKIITEGYNMEAAEEINTIFTKQIKKLAKLE